MYPVSRLQSELIVQSSSGSLSSGSAVAAFSIQLRVHSSRGRNTTPLSHLADVASAPSLSLSGSISNSCPLRRGQWGGLVCVRGADARRFIVCARQGEEGKEMKRMQEMWANKETRKKREGGCRWREIRAVCLSTASFPQRCLNGSHPLCFSVKVKLHKPLLGVTPCHCRHFSVCKSTN